MKLILIVLCAAALVAGSCSKSSDPQAVVIPAKELLVNPSAESGSTTPDSWFPFATNPLGTVYTSAWSNATAFAGTHSLKITAEGTNGPNFLYWAQTVLYDANTMSGKSLSLKVMIKTDKVEASSGNYGVGVFLNVIDNNNNVIESANTASVGNIVGTNDWTRYTVTTKNVITTNTKYVAVVLALGTATTGTVYFDDMSLKGF